MDKYNLMYIYPLDFESQVLSRKTLVKNSFYAIVLFQLGMISVGTLKDGLIDARPLGYLLSFVFI